MENEAPTNEQGQVYTTDSDIVYPISFLKDEFCTTFENMSVNDYGACLIQYQITSQNMWLNVIFGLLVGYFIARGVFKWR